MQPRVFDPAIPAQRTARGVVSVQNTGDQPIRFGVQVRVGEDRPLAGFVSQTQAQMVTSPLVPPGQTQQVTVFIPLPEEPGAKVFVVSINELDLAGRFVRELDARRFEGLASILGAVAPPVVVPPPLEPPPVVPPPPVEPPPVAPEITPGFKFGDIVLQTPTGFNDVTQVAPIPGATLGPAFTSGQLVFANLRGGTNPLNFSWRVLGPSRIFTSRFETMEITPVAGRNTLPIRLRVSPDAPPGPYFLEVIVENTTGDRIASRVFPNVFEVLAAPEPPLVPTEPALVPTAPVTGVGGAVGVIAPTVAPAPEAVLEVDIAAPTLAPPQTAPANTVFVQRVRFIDPLRQSATQPITVDVLDSSISFEMEILNNNDFPVAVVLFPRLRLGGQKVASVGPAIFPAPVTLPANQTFTLRIPANGATSLLPAGTYGVLVSVTDPQILDIIVSERSFFNVITISAVAGEPQPAPFGSVRPTRAQFDTPIVQAPISETNRITVGVRNNNDFPVRVRVFASLVSAMQGTTALEVFDPTLGELVDVGPGDTVDVSRVLSTGTYFGLAAGGYHVNVRVRGGLVARDISTQRFSNVFTVRPTATVAAQLLSQGDVFVSAVMANPSRAPRGQLVLIDVDVENRTTKPGAVSVRLTLSDISVIDVGVLSTRLELQGVSRVTFRWVVPTDVRIGTYLARVQVFDLDRPTTRLATQDFSRVVSVVGDISPF